MTVILKSYVIHFPITAKCFLQLYMQYKPQKRSPHNFRELKEETDIL